VASSSADRVERVERGKQQRDALLVENQLRRIGFGRTVPCELREMLICGPGDWRQHDPRCSDFRLQDLPRVNACPAGHPSGMGSSPQISIRVQPSRAAAASTTDQGTALSVAVMSSVLSAGDGQVPL
jgi:hypothetical protein